MASRELPSRPNLEHLRNEAKDLHRTLEATGPGTKLSDAQLAVARSYGFPSWPKLREHVETINRYFWPPVEAGSDDEDLDLVERFLASACLTYSGAEARRRPREAAALLDANPEIATSSVHAMAAANEADALREAIVADPAAVERPGGPHRWVPLLYAAYARVPGLSTLDAARVLLDAGADPNAGSLWDGRFPFTALTGVLGGGEDGPNQPRHPDGIAFARLLLDAGASPNDTQAIYNGTFLPDDAHLEMLFEYGLGSGDPGPWAARLGPRASSVADYLLLNLEWAAEHGFVQRVRLLLDHGVDPNSRSHYAAPDDRSAYEMAEAAGNREIAELLLAAGAQRRELAPVERFVAACMRADRAEVATLRTEELVRRAEHDHAPVAWAAELGRRDAVRLMLDVGFDINALADVNALMRGPGGTALHAAAAAGNLELVRQLIEWGADPAILDPTWNATPRGWAEYGGHEEVAQYLASAHPGSS
jgi:ankyrin repeat protein